MVKIDIIIQASKDDFAKKKTVAFVGERKSGKTVITAILKHAMVNHFIVSNPQWKVWVIEGSSRINDITKKLTNGKFPGSTLPGDASPITLEIFSNEGTGGGIEITLQDMAGESKEKFLRKEFKNEDDRIRDIFTQQPIKGKPYGMLAHLAFAKIYVLVVDCGKFEDWENEQSYLANTIRSLSLIQKRVGNDNNGKIISPMAIIFSKYDRLPKEEQKTAEKLLEKLPEFKSALEIAHKGNRRLFLSKIKSNRRTAQELAQLIQNEILIKNTKLNQTKRDIIDAGQVLANAKNELEDIRQQLNESKKELEDATNRNVPEEIQNAQTEISIFKVNYNDANDAWNDAAKTLNTHKSIKTEIETRLKKEQPSATDLGISEFKPTTPLRYNVDQYLDLISWIIQMNKE